ncbi:unnamed protein product [Alopecurus aequalis]
MFKPNHFCLLTCSSATISDFSSPLPLSPLLPPTHNMPRRHQKIERASDCNAVYDTGSSLYDSYELASVNRILDRHLAGLPSPDDESSAAKGPGAPPMEGKNKQVVAFGTRRKVTLRALFRGVVSWAVRPTQRRACTCGGVAPARSSAVGSESVI